MQIFILGNGSGGAIKRRNTSIGIISNRKRILIEVPKAIMWLYENENFAKNLDYVIITHGHHDHFGDIEGLLFRKEAYENKGFILIIPPNVNFPLMPGYEPKYMKKIITKKYDGNISVEFFEVPHFIPTYGVKVKVDGKCIGYSSDTSEVVLENLKDCDLIFHDCSGRADHTSEEEVYKVAKQLGIENKVYAIHVEDKFKPKYLKLAERTYLL